jgi:phenylacetate-CoA ligase
MADMICGYRRVDAHRLGVAECRAYARKLLSWRPAGIIGYSSALDSFARHNWALRDEFRELGVRFVLLTSEVAPRPDSLAFLRDMFACPIVQEYGGAEFGQIAFAGDDEIFQVFDDLNYLERRDAELEGEEVGHEIIVTTLYHRYVPLFRYRMGDVVLRPTLLPHGHVTRFQGLSGRNNIELTLPNGSAIHTVSIFHCIYQEPSVLNIQLVIRDDELELRLVCPSAEKPQIEERIRGRLRQVNPVLGTARIQFTDALEQSRAGKHRWFIDERTGTQPVDGSGTSATPLGPEESGRSS